MKHISDRMVMKMAAIESSQNTMEIIQGLKLIAPEVWDSNKRKSILPQTLGDLNKPEYVEAMQDRLRKLNEYKDMLNAGLISEEMYELKKDEILF